MKKKYILITVITSCLIIIGTVLILSKTQKVSNKIMSYYNKKEETTFEVRLSDFTAFDWDNVIIYKSPVTKIELNEITGISYTKELDLQSGMIFVKDNKVVCEEAFITDFESPYIFIIYPYDDINSEIKVNKIEKENAIFKGEKIKYNNENRYVLKPIK